MQPFGLTCGYVCINDDLSAVEEIAELGLPDYQVTWIVQRVTVLVAHDGLLGQMRVANLQKVLLVLVDVVQRYVGLGSVLVNQPGWTRTDRPASAVLTTHTNVEALHQERSEG